MVLLAVGGGKCKKKLEMINIMDNIIDKFGFVLL